jgi:hypothetical protein
MRMTMLGTTSSCSKNAHRYVVLLHSNSGSYTKNNIADSQGMLNVIQHTLPTANFAIDYPVLLEINRKIAIMGGG